MNGDYILVDLLDGAHLPTLAAPSPLPMSTNSDSIISLPPVDSATSYFARKRAEAARSRRDRRATSSIGSNFHHVLHNTPESSTAQLDDMLPPSTFSDKYTPRLSDVSPPTSSPHHVRSPPSPTPPPQPPPSSRRTPSGVFPAGTVPSVPFFTPSVDRALPPRATPPISHTPLPPAAAPPPDPSAISRARPLKAPVPPSPHRAHVRLRSGSVRMSRDWNDDDMTGAFSTTSSAQRRRQPKEAPFHPSEWNWRKPAEEDAVMPNAAWIYLALIGSLTFLTAFIVNFCVNLLTDHVIAGAATFVADYYGNQYAHVAVLGFLRAICLVISFVLVLKLSPLFAAGSGIPEMKCVLSGVFMNEMLNWRTLVGKMLGLVFSLSSGVSIGRLGPFIHMSGITASLVAQMPIFPSLNSNVKCQLQAFSAAMAAGVGATFGAPIGGTMLAIEVMSTYYYIHWLPMAMYCSITGYYFVLTFLNGSNAYLTTNVSIDVEMDSFRRLSTYVMLGALCGLAGAALIRFTKQAFKFRRRYFKNTTPGRTIAMLACFAIAHTIITMNIGTLMRDGGKASVLTLINAEAGTDVTGFRNIWQPFPSSSRWNVAVGLTIVLIVKFILTGLSLVLPVPAGTFMPIFEVGALLGRAFGEWCSGIPYVTWVDPRATAIIGAAGLATGTLHTTSIAVVMLELTREAIDVLPLAIGVIVSYGVSKCITADLFSELIRIRKLPFILGIRDRYPAETRQFYEDVSSEVAGSFMNKNFPFVTPYTTRGEIYEMLTRRDTPWITCAFLSDKDNRRLWGTVSRTTLWDVVMEDMQINAEGELNRPEYGTFNLSESSAERGLETVEFLRDFDPSVGHPLVDMGPMQVSFHMPLWKIITFFRMLSLNTMYVLLDGVTVGNVTKMELIRHTASVEERERRKRRIEQGAELQRQRTQRLMADALRNSGDATLRSRPSLSDLSKAPLLMGERSGGRHRRQNSIGQARRWASAKRGDEHRSGEATG